MRLLLVLLAMFTGLSLPEAAVARSRAEVADMGVAPSSAVSPTERAQPCTGRGGVAPRRQKSVQRKTVWLPTVALIRPCGLILSDRARE